MPNNNLVPFDLPFAVPEISKEHLPYAYALLGVGLLILVKKPSTIISLLSTYYMWQSTISKAADKLNLN